MFRSVLDAMWLTIRTSVRFVWRFVVRIENHMQEEDLGMVVGTILSVEKADNSDRLFLLKIEAGGRVYQVATSLAAFFEMRDLIGQQVPILTTVQPRKIRGNLSETRLIAILNEDKEPVLLVPARRVPNGSIVM